jgi:hypothetical protein
MEITSPYAHKIIPPDAGAISSHFDLRNQRLGG